MVPFASYKYYLMLLISLKAEVKSPHQCTKPCIFCTCAPFPISPTSPPPAPPASLCSNHTGLPVIPMTHAVPQDLCMRCFLWSLAWLFPSPLYPMAPQWGYLRVPYFSCRTPHTSYFPCPLPSPSITGLTFHLSTECSLLLYFVFSLFPSPAGK